jgi:hypothetical protein
MKMLPGLLLVYAIPKQALEVTVAKAEASFLWPFQASWTLCCSPPDRVALACVFESGLLLARMLLVQVATRRSVTQNQVARQPT